MTPEEYQTITAALHWGDRDIATELRVNETTPRQWRTGKREIPAPVAKWLRGLAACHTKHPPPAAPERPPARGRPPGGRLPFGEA
jgi:hypothetical protein